MNFNQRPELSGQHAFLSPSNYHWLNDSDQKLEARYSARSGARRGTALHDLAHSAIQLGVQLDSSNDALYEYVRDGIGYRMTCEQPLFYSFNCFGTADTICFRDGLLRVHDLKTGITATSEKQLEVYAAIFCLEYQVDPREIDIELRIYQREEVRVFVPYAETILAIMDKIVYFDEQIEMMKASDRF